MAFCNRCNTNLEDYMRFCWNCGMPVSQQQVFGGGPPVHAQANVHHHGHHGHGHGQYRESYTVSTGGADPYQQSVTVTYGGPGGPPQTVYHEQRRKTLLTCPFCNGGGNHPMNFDQPCPICRGAGSLTVYEPYTTCQHCDGSGKKFATMDEICPACGGRGVIQM